MLWCVMSCVVGILKCEIGFVSNEFIVHVKQSGREITLILI